MARFRAYSSDDSSSDDEPVHEDVLNKNAGANEGTQESDQESASDLDEDDLVLSSPTRPRSRKPVLDVQSDEETDEEVEEADEEEEEETRSPSRARPESSSVIPWAQRVGVDAQKMHVMQTSLFRVPEESAALREINRPSRLAPQVIVTSKSRPLNRKHSRDSEGDSLRIDSRKRTSFAHDVDPNPYRPSRKYARVDNSSSVVAEHESAHVDAGLSRGRSFGVGWGPGGKLVHLGRLCSPLSSSASTANSSVVNLSTIHLFSSTRDEQIAHTTKLLQHHLSNTPIVLDQDIPIADPSTSLTFSSFSSLFPLADSTPLATIFRLGHALFDELDLHLPNSISPDIRSRIATIRRKAALSTWLENVVAPSVEDILKTHVSSPLAATFALLTGNQVEKACDAAMDGGNVKLATLVSQAGGDFEFREDIRRQLAIWQEQHIDVHIDDNVRKVYALLAGLIDEVVEGSKAGSEQCSDVDVTEGLDWKRVFGLCLWYLEPINASIADVFQSYSLLLDQSHRDIADPKPHYALSATPTSPWRFPEHLPPDALYSLMHLHADPSLSLSHVFDPLSFSSSPLDASICWHLYILLSRCMRIRDLGDRQAPAHHHAMSSDDEREDDDEFEGHSHSADLLCSQYALQLERLGLIQEAVFVLLHIEGPSGRRKAIKDLLARSAHVLDEWVNRGLMGSLKIPLDWVNEAKAIHAISKSDYRSAYDLYLAAGMYNDAHEIAVHHLAPDAVIQRNFDWLKTLFSKFEGKSVDGWFTRGKIFLDYVECMNRLPELAKSLNQAGNAVPDAAEESALEDLSRTVPRLIGILPDLLNDRTDPRHDAALSEMTKNLIQRLDNIKPLALVNARSIRHVDEATRLRHVRSSAFAKFMKDVEIAAAA